MNIKQALKQKNKLVKKTSDLYNRLNENNSVEEGAVRHYDVEETLTELLNNVDDLVELKTKIHMANMEVYNKIFEMSELKSLLKNLRGLDCGEGTVRKMHRYSDETPMVKTTIIDVVRRNNLIELLEVKIERLQDELDVLTYFQITFVILKWLVWHQLHIHIYTMIEQILLRDLMRC